MSLHDEDVASLRSALTAEQEHRRAVEKALERADQHVEQLRYRLDATRHERDEYRKAAEAADRIATDAIAERDELGRRLKATRKGVDADSPTGKLIVAYGEIDRLAYLEKDYRIRAQAAEAALKELMEERDGEAAPEE